MPTINVKRDLLEHHLGAFTDKQFDELCFQYGIELDEITSEKKMAMKENSATGKESDDIIFKIDIPANRYDLLSMEGLVTALKIFRGDLSHVSYKVEPSGLKFFVDSKECSFRPVLLGAVVRDINMTEDLYNSFIDLQDKIHHIIGRKRTIVSIGTHDLDSIQGPFQYTAIDKNQLKFTPLNQEQEFTGAQLMEFYADSHLKPYLSIIEDQPKFPVILDSNKTVLSMPPIINGDVSKITLNTKNILIEVTATDREKATIALDTIVTMLLMTKSNPSESWIAETVEIIHNTGENYTTPNLSCRTEVFDRDYINKGLGLDLDIGSIERLLEKMGLIAHNVNPEQIKVYVPPTRHDIINRCDIMEDIAIAYGYDNIPRSMPKSATIASQVYLNKLSDQLRGEIARCGFTETLNFALCSQAEISTMLRTPGINTIVKIQNPKTSEFQVARTCLLTGLLKTLNSNKKMPLPMKLFEVSDIVCTKSNSNVGAINQRHLAAIYYGKQTSGFEIIHGLLDRIMQVMDVKCIQGEPKKTTEGYYIEAAHNDSYLSGRCAKIVYNGAGIGFLGILHPEVMTNFGLNHPASAVELNIEKFDLLNNK